MATAVEQEELPVLVKLKDAFNSELNRFESICNEIGYKVTAINGNSPEGLPESKSPEPSCFTSDMELKINRLSVLNDRLGAHLTRLHSIV